MFYFKDNKWKKTKYFFQNLVVSFAGLVIGILFVEFLLRFFPKYSFDSMAYIRDSLPMPKIFIDRYRPSKIFGYEHNPKHPLINSLGMADKEYSIKKPNNTFRILILGNSITECQAWPDIIEEKLNKKTKIKFEVLNAGVGGWSLLQYYKYVKHKAIILEPDLIIIAFCLNDLDVINLTLYKDKVNNKIIFFETNNSNNNFFNPKLFYKSYMYRFLFAHIFGRYNKTNKAKYNYENYFQMLLEMKSITNNKIIFIIFPFLKHLKDYEQNQLLSYKKIVNLLNDSNVKYFNLVPLLEKCSKIFIINIRRDKNDYVHFNEEGNRFFAKYIFEYLNKYLANNYI